MANWGIYGFPEPEPGTKSKRLYNDMPHRSQALTYYNAEMCFADTSMGDRCSVGDEISAIADLGFLGDHQKIASSIRPRLIIDSGNYPAIAMIKNSTWFEGTAQYQSTTQVMVIRSPFATFDQYGYALGPRNIYYRHIMFSGVSDRIHTHGTYGPFNVWGTRNGVAINPIVDGAFSPLTQIQVLWLGSDYNENVTWGIGYSTPPSLFIYEIANFPSKPSDLVMNDITNYFMGKYKI